MTTHTVVYMDPLTTYFLRQAGVGGWSIAESIGPVYSGPPFLQRVHGIGSFLRFLFRIVKPVLLSGTKALGRESLRTGARIMKDIAEIFRRPNHRISSQYT
jgi:hypothetical protein